nr:hypothetical protein [uncultured Porphyromonas sp.]
MIASVASYYHLTPNYILDEMTMEDLVMYARVIPSFESKSKSDTPAPTETREANSIGDFARMIQAQQE